MEVQPLEHKPTNMPARKRGILPGGDPLECAGGMPLQKVRGRLTIDPQHAELARVMMSQHLSRSQIQNLINRVQAITGGEGELKVGEIDTEYMLICI